MVVQARKMASTSGADGAIDLTELLSACVDLGVKAGHEIRRIVEAGGDLGVQNKGDDAHFDPQTVADVTAEKLIVGSLRKAWPGIAIVGEEGVEAVDEKFVVAPHRGLLTAVMAEGRAPRPKWGTATLGNVVVFVDPLDGTKEFTEGITSAVTVLIGVALDGRPIAGVICQPWGPPEIPGSQRCVWASIYDGPFHYVYPHAEPAVPEDGKCWGKLETKLNAADSMVVGTTRSHGRPEVEAAIVASRATDVIRIGGAGNKVLQLIEGNIDCYLFPCMGTKRWDTCAGEAVLISAGGTLTDKNGGLYHYANDADPSVVANSDGIVACIDTRKHAVFVAACE